MAKKILIAADLAALLLKAETLEQVKKIAEDAIESLSASENIIATEKAAKETAENSLKETRLKLKTAEADATQALEQMGELGLKLDLLEKNRGDNSLIVQIGKKNYKILGDRFITKDGELNAEELSKNEPELKRMLKIGSGSLVEID